MVRLPFPASVGALAVAVTLAGCGEPDAVRDRDGVLRIALDEYTLRPQNIEVRSGRVRVKARNEGRLTHNLKILSADREEGEPYFEFGATPTAQPGQTVETTLFLRPGEYRLSCSIANHDSLGQWGTLEVTEK